MHHIFPIIFVLCAHCFLARNRRLPLAFLVEICVEERDTKCAAVQCSHLPISHPVYPVICYKAINNAFYPNLFFFRRNKYFQYLLFHDTFFLRHPPKKWLSLFNLKKIPRSFIHSSNCIACLQTQMVFIYYVSVGT